MLDDLLKVFQKKMDEKGEKLILGSYALKEGLYVKIKKDGNCEYFINKMQVFKEDKKTKKELVFLNVNNKQDSVAKNWFKERDYISSYINSNKAILDKKIFSVNYFSLFFKLENSDVIKELVQSKKEKNTKNNASYFDVFRDYKKFSKKEEKEILKQYETFFLDKNRLKDVETKQKTLTKKYNEIIQQAIAKAKEIELQKINKNDKKYVTKKSNIEKLKAGDLKNFNIRVFFDEPLKSYKNESEIYLTLKIFNSTDYNQHIDNKLIGLSNSNMGLNTKKPYLEHKTKKTIEPFLIEQKTALHYKLFFDWLKNQNRNQNDRILDDSIFLTKFSKNDEAIISHFDYIPIESDAFDKKFKPIDVVNFLRIRDKDKNLLENYKISSIGTLENEVNDIFFNGKLLGNYYTEKIKISDSVSKDLQKILYLTRDGLLLYFKKFDDSRFLYIVKRYFTDLIIELLKQDYGIKAKQALNLKFSILQTQGETSNMDIRKMKAKVVDLIKQPEQKPSKEEFLFLSGQWAYYLLSQSKASKKNFQMAERYLKAKTLKNLKSALQLDLSKYKHEISLTSPRHKGAVAQVSNYTGEEKITSDDKDIFLVGFTVDNLFYEKTSANKGDNNE